MVVHEDARRSMYVLIASTYQAVEGYRRMSPRWIYEAYGPSGVVELASIGVRLPVVSLYLNAGVSAGSEELEGEV